MQNILTIILPFFLLVLTGYAAGRTNIIAEAAINGLTRFVFYFSLPAMLFAIMASKSAGQILNLPFILAYATAAILTFVLWLVAGRALFQVSLSQASVLGLGATYGNIGFMAVPLLIGVLGDQAAFPVALVLSVDLILLVPFGIIMIEMGENEENTWAHAGAALRRTLTKNPLVIAIFSGLAIGLAGLPLPGVVDSFARFLGSAAAPVAMFTLGASLARRSAGEGMGAATYMAAGKLFFFPVMVWGAMVAAGVDAFWLKTAVAAAAMPVAANLFVMAEKYDACARETSSGIMISTAVSMLTLTVLLTAF